MDRRLIKPGIHGDLTDVMAKIFVEVSKLHRVIILQMTLPDQHIHLCQFHDLGSKPKLSGKFFYFKSAAIFHPQLNFRPQGIFQ